MQLCLTVNHASLSLTNVYDLNHDKLMAYARRQNAPFALQVQADA